MSAAEQEAIRELPYVQAVAEGVRHALYEFDETFLAGEDVGLAGSVFGVYRGLHEEFGDRRIIDTPISEAGIIGLGVGAAATGLRPIVDIMMMDFIGECMDEIANQMAKMRFMFGGKTKLPVTVLTMGGAAGSLAAQHSQCLEAWLCHLPGLKVMIPTTPYDVKGAIVAANREENPVFVVLNKGSLAITGPVPEESYTIPIGEANVVRTGSDVTVVAVGRMMFEALNAADELEKEGISLEVIDPRTLLPFDTDTVVTSVKKTHRALVVHEAVRFGGFGAEIASQIQEEAFDYLDAPVARVGAPFSPVPYSPVLEAVYVPDAKRIAASVREMYGR